MKKSTIVFITLILLAIALLIATIVLGILSWKAKNCSSSYYVTEGYVEQKQDHEDTDSNLTWYQQYFVDTSKWGGPGNPVFLRLGGESDAKYDSFNEPWCSQYASEFKAMCFVLEHR